jgi:hypothetical protein
LCFCWLFAAPASAQLELVVIEKPFAARTLSGIVVDSTGAAVSGVVVEQCDVLFNPIKARNAEGEPTGEVLPGDCSQEPSHVVASAKTDEKGHFSFPSAKTGRTYYLHLSCPGFDPMQIAVKLRFYSRSGVRIKLRVAT